MIIFKGGLNYVVGVIIGCIVAFAWILDINRSINKSIELSEKDASNYAARSAIIRYIVIAVVGIILALIKQQILIGYIIGLLGLKISVYVQGFYFRERGHK